ncbi:hypothetical protein C5167_043300 [Papaver somniferum]|uniref:Uncharacterized protein n=1 Tax=Papaver somniferum TaxID=3469 RepID=A0A4Y7L6Z5_PAPSO|nr:hypothetical protein C5167_043300 [Papaver somniferum]
MHTIGVESTGLKSQFIQICPIISRSAQCNNHPRRGQALVQFFVYWYLILQHQVEENAEIDKVREYYQKLGKHHHHHPNSNKARRLLFDFERLDSQKFCQRDKTVQSEMRNTNTRREALRKRFIKENMVIQNCVKVQTSTQELDLYYIIINHIRNFNEPAKEEQDGSAVSQGRARTTT